MLSSQEKIQKINSLEGVPLFHVQSLEVSPASKTIKVTPLFLCKKDAYFALNLARHLDDERRKLLTENILHKAESAVAKASSLLQNAIDLKNIKLERKYREHKSMLDKQLEACKKQDGLKIIDRTPKIEVGCL